MKCKSIQYSAVTILLLLLSMILNPVVQAKNRAAGDIYKMNINISGVVTATGRCSFNNQGPLTVDFGDIRYSTVGYQLEGIYVENLVSDMTCTGDTAGGSTMTLSSPKGDSMDYQGKKALVVTLEGSSADTGLGIVLLVNGQPQDVNTAFVVNMESPPKLEAQLVQSKTSGTLTNGSKISSAATLTMAFD